MNDKGTSSSARGRNYDFTFPAAGKTIFMRKSDWEKWDSALRSGKYDQGRSALERYGRYCCLGVLQMELSGFVERNENGHAQQLPSMEWLSEHGITFRSKTGSIVMNPSLGEKKAATLNDAGISFTNLADLITQYVQFTEE